MFHQQFIVRVQPVAGRKHLVVGVVEQIVVEHEIGAVEVGSLGCTHGASSIEATPRASQTAVLDLSLFRRHLFEEVFPVVDGLFGVGGGKLEHRLLESFSSS